MNDNVIVPIFVVIDDVMYLFDHRTHPQAGASDREVLTSGGRRGLPASR